MVPMEQMADFLSTGEDAMGSIVSGALGFMGQRQANEQNTENMYQQEQFNSAQAAINRQFTAQQAGIQRNWEDAEQNKAMNFDLASSNTAMQRRVQDLKASGLNPLLAIGQGGASTPMMGAPSGASASGAAASAGGMPQIQNAMAAGLQSAQAAAAIEQQQAAARQLSAQATKTKSETPSPRYTTVDDKTGEIQVNADAGHELGDASLNNIVASTGLMTDQAVQVKKNVDLIGKQILNTDANTAATNVAAALSGQRLEIIQATKQYIIQQAAASGVEAGNVQNLLKDKTWGPVITILDRLLKPAASAIGAVF